MIKQISWRQPNNDMLSIEDSLEDEETSEFDSESSSGHGSLLVPASLFMNDSSNINDSEDYNFFIAHTNFYITLPIVKFLCQVIGVESVDILSPYRFRISVGPLFDAQEVLDYITNNLTQVKDAS